MYTLSPWTIYLWGICDGLKDLTFTVGMVALVTFFATTMFGTMMCSEGAITKKQLTVAATALLLASLLSHGTSVLIPDRKTLAVMVIAPAIVNSTAVQKDLPEVYAIALDAVKEGLKGAIAPEQKK